MEETQITPSLSVRSWSSISTQDQSSISTQDQSSTAGQASSTGPQPSKPSVIPPPVKSKGPSSGAGVRRMRRIIAEDAEWSVAIVPLLTELCIQHIVKNFQHNPILKQLPPEHQKKVLNHLSPDLPLAVTANLIEDESYWRRCCTQRWPVCHVDEHGGSWKRMFFELHLENLLKHFIPSTTDPEVILNLLPLCRNYVHTIQIFRLTRSKVDDDKARILICSLLDHAALEELDLSHNLIGDRGARAAAKLLGHSRLRVLNLANNQVRAPGAQSLAHALAHNSDLVSLNLRLNCIEDEGGQALAHALQTNKCLTTLHLGGNELSEPTATLLSQVLSINTTLTSINLSCNRIGPDGGKQLLEGMSDNKTLLEFDLRLSDIAQESEYLIGQALCANREAAHQRALSPSHFMSPATAKGPENPAG
ncbi:hypothetical protein E2I00_004490 [Balaenoptera physalus]|uniref:T-complex-associated testis-expressed protein 1 n=1 Tax=Balaenoptera physalus TaxID=9770 RepID=A0A643CCB3_BALPH|nr:hypothetical protein E2I00_004490 [Balaenoptera physalus]